MPKKNLLPVPMKAAENGSDNLAIDKNTCSRTRARNALPVSRRAATKIFPDAVMCEDICLRTRARIPLSCGGMPTPGCRCHQASRGASGLSVGKGKAACQLTALKNSSWPHPADRYLSGFLCIQHPSGPQSVPSRSVLACGKLRNLRLTGTTGAPVFSSPGSTATPACLAYQLPDSGPPVWQAGYRRQSLACRPGWKGSLVGWYSRRRQGAWLCPILSPC